MRLVLFDPDIPDRRNFYPLALSRPIWELRCGITSLREKLIAGSGAMDVAYFAPQHLAAAYKARTEYRVNDAAALKGDDLLLVNARLKADALEQIDRKGTSRCVVTEQGEVLCGWLRQQDAGRVDSGSIESLLESARKNIATAPLELPAWKYTWDLVLASPHQITADFKTLGRS